MNKNHFLQNGAFFEKDLYHDQQQIDNEVKHEWCLNLIQDSDTIIIKHSKSLITLDE